MQLVYRGISYQTNSTQSSTSKQEVNGQYRGISYQIRKINNAKIKNICVLKYRGAD